MRDNSRKSPEERLIEKLLRAVDDNGCLVLPGTREDKAPLISYKVDGVWKNASLVRYLWTMVRGPIPDGLGVLHKCDNRRCMRLRHLFLGTPKDNTQDMIRKGRMVKAQLRGEDHYAARLTNEQVACIKRMYLDGVRPKDLVRLYRSTQSTIACIVAGTSWPHIKPAPRALA